MIEELTELLRGVNESPEFFKEYARIIKNLYDALTEEGLPQEVAISICQHFKVGE